MSGPGVTSKPSSKLSEIRPALLEAETGDPMTKVGSARMMAWDPLAPADGDEKGQGNGILSKYIYLPWSLTMKEVEYKSVQQRNIITI